MADATPDALSQVATTFRLRGSLGGSFSVTAPFGLAMPKSDHAGLLVVTRGRVHFEMDGEPHRTLELAPGDVVALPHGHAHSLRDDPDTPLRPMHTVQDCVSATTSPPKGGQAEFLVLCCELAGGRANPLLRVLPPLIHCPGSEGRVARWLEPTVRLLAAESAASAPGRATILDRLAEVVFIQLIRAWLEGLPEGEGGWLRALRDPQLAAALEAIHGEPGAAWTVGTLAARVHMSRSAFAGRFKSLVGESPLEYVTRWRVQRAAELLQSDEVPLKRIVAMSGYASEAAFRTAFRRWIGESPATYRARARASRDRAELAPATAS